MKKIMFAGGFLLLLFCGWALLNSDFTQPEPALFNGKTTLVTRDTIVEKTVVSGKAEPATAPVITTLTFDSTSEPNRGLVKRIPPKIGDILEEEDLIVAYENGTEMTAAGRDQLTDLKFSEHSDPNKPAELVSFTLQGLEKFHVRLLVPEKTSAAVQPGHTVRLTANNREYSGFVSEIDSSSHYEDQGQQSVRTVYVSFNQQPSDIQPGQPFKAEIITGIARNVLCLPKKALLQDENNVPSVYTISSTGQLQKVAPVFGLSSQSQIEIIEGLTENNLVVLAPAEQLQEGLIDKNE